MKIICLLLLANSAWANYNISSHTKDGITMTTNQEPQKGCVLVGRYSFTAKSMARDEDGIIAAAKSKKGNYVVEEYDNYPSMRHFGKVFKCP